MNQEYFLGDYNALENKKMNLPDKVTLFDTTLRDGEQIPGVSFTDQEKLEIAEILDRMGVDCIEAGFPINSKPELNIIKEINKQGFKSRIY
ncbi:MAG: homoaconitate hydratase, partial [Candidatus Ranarchaeia archaeon]